MKPLRPPDKSSGSTGPRVARRSSGGSPSTAWHPITCDSMGSFSEELTQTSSLHRSALMLDTVHLDEQFYIVAETERSTTPQRVMKQGDSFAVFDTHGDITPATIEQGFYHRGTRFLSRLELLLGR